MPNNIPPPIEPQIIEFDLSDLVLGRSLKLGNIKAITHYDSRIPLFAADMASIKHLVIESICSDKYDIIVSPEDSFVLPNGPMTEHEKNEHLNDLVNATLNKRVLVIPGTFIWHANGELYNTAYVLSNGKIILEYHKRNNGGDYEIAAKHNLRFRPGSKPGVFSWNDLRMGVEICYDAGTLNREGFEDLDVIFLICCGLRNFCPPEVRPYGYIVINDGFLAADSYQQTVYRELPRVRSSSFNRIKLSPAIKI